MKQWNNRIVYIKNQLAGIKEFEGRPEEPLFELVEMYYNEWGLPCGYSTICTVADDMEGMKQLVERMQEALALPVIEPHEIIGWWSGCKKH
jgi:hypothetical protein